MRATVAAGAGRLRRRRHAAMPARGHENRWAGRILPAQDEAGGSPGARGLRAKADDGT